MHRGGHYPCLCLGFDAVMSSQVGLKVTTSLSQNECSNLWGEQLPSPRATDCRSQASKSKVKVNALFIVQLSIFNVDQLYVRIYEIMTYNYDFKAFTTRPEATTQIV